MVTHRCMGFLLLPAVLWVSPPAAAQPAAAGSSPPQPTLYELMINGETFLVEPNRVDKFKSQRPGGATYDVALRIAPVQRIRLENLTFDYDMPAAVEKRGPGEGLSAKVRHELGFTLLVNDLGRALAPDQQTQVLDRMVDSARSTFQELAAREVTVEKPHQRKFASASAAGVTVRYRDKQNLGHTCLVYVFSGERFAGSCLVQYLDQDQADVLPLVKKTLDSLRAAG
jgi:hypothetical protein